MTVWMAVLVAGGCSYLLRVLPMLLGGRVRLSERTQRTLRHAGMGGIAAILAGSLAGIGRAGDPFALAAALASVAAAGVLAARGRSVAVVLVVGGVVYGGSIAAVAVLA